MKYIETFEKIKADGELKERLVANTEASAFRMEDGRLKKRQVSRVRFRWNRIAAAATAAAVAVVMALSSAMVFGNFIGGGNNPWTGEGDNPVNVMAPLGASRDDIVNLLSKNKSEGVGGGESGGLRADGVDAEVSFNAEANKTNTASVPPGGNDFATTNVQQEGVDEGDIIKVDNNFIYTLSRGGLRIVSVAGKMKISYEQSFENFYPDEMFILGDKLIVIGGEYTQFYYPDMSDIGIALVPYWSYRSHTKIIIYDLRDRVNVKLLQEYSITGNFITSRLIDDRLIVAISCSVNYNDENTYFPRINGDEVNAKDISVYETDKYANYAIIASVNLKNQKLEVSAHLGLITGWYGASAIYFSKNNVYFFVSMYRYEIDERNGYYNYIYYTVIVKINLNSLKYSASNEIDGRVGDRYWADEYKNNLRVVSVVSPYNNTRYTNVYVLNNNLEIIGTITNIAPGENVYSVRFNGDEGSIVTFLQIDPLFKLDLSDPKNPAISKGLKEAGVNDYLQYLSDDVILGLGRNTSETNGWTQFMGMKVAIYDNTGADAVNIKTIPVGSGYAYSEALYNPKAILNDTAKNMFSFAVTMTGNNSLSLEGQGLMVFEYNLNAKADNDKLIYRGLLTNVRQNQTYASWNDYYYDYFSYVQRGVRIGDRIYTVSDRFITSYDIKTLNQIQQLSLEPNPCHFTHKWGEWNVTNPTCTKSGVQWRKCKICSREERYVLNPYGHYYGNWTVTNIPTATTPGTETRTCNRCGHVETRQLVGAVGEEGLVLVLNEDGKGYRVRTYMGSGSDITIPAAIKGKPVTALDDYAFQNSKIKSVTIPASVISMGYSVFQNCASLQSVTFAQNSRLEALGAYAFYNCTMLKTITLPKGLKHISYYAFYNCKALNKIELPQDLTALYTYAFYGCDGLESVTIPQNVTSIYYGAFANCKNLRSVYIPASVTYISNEAFSQNPSLQSLTVASGNTVYKSKGDCIIQISTDTLIIGCNNSVIPDYITSIGNYAFYGSGVKRITIPKNVEHINYYAFNSCANLQNVTFEKGSKLKTISSYAFAHCTAVTSFDIPQNVASVGYYAFSNWTLAQTINVYGAADQYGADVKLGVNWRAGCGAVIKYFE